VPQEQARNNKGFDICSLTLDGHAVFIKVKGRIAGADDFTVTRNEVLYGKNADRYRLALVSVSHDGPEHDQVRYLTDLFGGLMLDEFAVDSIRFNWDEMWSRGTDPT
jgi:hypothetical protein